MSAAGCEADVHAALMKRPDQKTQIDRQEAPASLRVPALSVGFVSSRADYSVTPDRRYYVVRGRLWRLSNPFLDEKTHDRLVNELLTAKRSVRDTTDPIRRITARLKADAAKRALGERGEVWWTDGAPDYHRKFAVGTPYAKWFVRLISLARERGADQKSVKQ
jgi:hypothetical protein